jgi:hypothetical protein
MYELAIGLLVAANVVAAVYAFVLWTGRFGDPAPQAAASPPAKPHRVTPPPPPQPPPPVERAGDKRVATEKPAQAVRVTIAATRGSCWISAHRGSQAGSLLMERTLLQGETVSLSGRRIWLELGAAGNVDVSVNGRPRPIALGTTELVLG